MSKTSSQDLWLIRVYKGMKIIHCCFGNEHYIDSWGYQQNLLPLYHAKLGHDVVVLASSDAFPSFVDAVTINNIKAKGNSYFNGPVRVERSPSWFPSRIHFQKAMHLLWRLRIEKPDIVFFHGGMNLSILSCVRYRRSHPDSTLFIDSHADSMNVNPNRLYRFLFLKIYWSSIHQYCQKYIDKYFGVTSGRCSFLVDYFHIKESRIQLLPIGADVDSAREISESSAELRQKFGFDNDDIIIVHGGKMDPRKGTVDLIAACRILHQELNRRIKVVLFGKVQDSRITQALSDDIFVYDWLSRRQVLELFKFADLAVWPIHHTTLIEDCVASGLPYLIRKTMTTSHLILPDFYLERGDVDELRAKIAVFLKEGGKSVFLGRIDGIRKRINYYCVAQSVIMLHKQIHGQNN